MEIRFTKKQQRKIDSCIDEKVKNLWIEHFTHIQKLKQSKEYNEFIKEYRKNI